MNETSQPKPGEPCDRPRPIKEYTRVQEILDNVPYGIMAVLGGVILATCLKTSAWEWPAAGAYLAYSLLGALWIIWFVCPYCHFYGTRSCPCGYGWIAPKFRSAKNQDRFARQFKINIPVLVPLWIVPPAAAGVSLMRGFNTPLLILMIVFIADSFVLLPLVSRIYGCAHCPQKADCPWMDPFRKSSGGTTGTH
jgi:hypothetical protein